MLRVVQNNKTANMGGVSRMAAHDGKVFFRLAATYPQIIDAILEAIQNAIDAGATVIQVEINRRKRTYAVRNNGPCATQESFENGLQNVGNSVKTPDKLGQFGIGNLSALGKCDRFTFTTLSEKEALRWTFVCDTIKEMRSVEIPLKVITQEALLAKEPAIHGVTRWSSELFVSQYTTDVRKSSFTTNELREGILGYSAKMREKGVVVWISDTDAKTNNPLKPVPVRAHDFAGRPLEEVRIPRGANGETRIRLFVVPKRDKRKGEVLFGTTTNPSRLRFKLFEKQMISLDFMQPEVLEAFKTGTFEGEILHSKIALNADRSGFDETDYLVQFCADLWEWYEENGKQHIEEAQDSLREERFMGLAKRLLESLDPLIKGSPQLALLFKGAGLGGTKGDAGGTSQSEKRKAPGSGGGRETPQEPRVKPKGEKRVTSGTKTHGLEIVYEEYMNQDLWDLDLKERTLTFNSRHPLFLACDKNDRDSLRFQQMIAVSALSLELLTEEEKESGRRYLDTQVPFIVELLTKSPLFNVGFGPRKPKP